MLLSACDQSFIDRPQLAVQTADNFYKTENDAVEAVTAVYNYFQSYDFEVSKFELVTLLQTMLKKEVNQIMTGLS